ncbi:Retinoic acid induced 16-like protein-domain-containing protein [Gloeopeniophorella convolvens]|nr:Retinoic acid induced 16-like protein-domain-containing protein [Gloeopeniophorella convolvens]
MDYFSKFLRSGSQSEAKPVQDNAAEFHKSWTFVKNTLLHPDERQLSRGITSTDVPAHLKVMVDLLVLESARTEEGGTGACLEYLLKNDVLGTLVRLSESDRPSGIQAEVLRAVQNMVILLDEQFLVHSAVHKAVLRLLRNCAGEDIQEQLDNQNRKVMGAARDVVRSSPSEYEEDLVNLLCILCSRIRTFRELLMIFFHDKHWYHSEPLFSVEEEEENEDDEDDEDGEDNSDDTSTGELKDQLETTTASKAPPSAAPGVPSRHKKSEYEFLLFNYLLRFVHREGQIGDFARAGLLFLMDVAMSPGDQEHRLAKDGFTPSESASEETIADPITDAALSLAEYVLDGDFSDVLGAGLGAVYSLLPSKLAVHAPATADENKGANMVLGAHPVEDNAAEGLEANREKSRALGVEDSRATDFKVRLDHFLKLLEFLQDIFRRNVPPEHAESGLEPSTLVGSAIVQSILEAVRQTFLENVLYPSILECSDADGSAVAVMSYIEMMIRTLEKGQLTDLFVNFLISEDNDDVPKSRPQPRSMLTLGPSAPPQTYNTDAQSKLRRRRSSAMILLEMEAPESTKQSEYFTTLSRFTLKDLLMSNLRSRDQPTAAAALQLLNSLLLRYNSLCIEKLLMVTRDPKATSFPTPAPEKSRTPSSEAEDEEDFVYPGEEAEALPGGASYAQPSTTYSTHEREMDMYLKLVSQLDPVHASNSFSTGYDRYLCDAIQAIQDHSSFTEGIDEETHTGMKHHLEPNDPILSAILEWLRRFLSNTPEFNVALTGVLASLAYDPLRSLAGWLTFGQREESAESGRASPGGQGVQEDGDDRSMDYRVEEMLASESRTPPASSLDDGSRPVILAVFQSLVAQLERYRRSVDNFDRYLLERRQGLLFSENLTDALTLALDFDDSAPSAPPTTTPSTPSSPPKAVPKRSGSFVSFLTPKLKSKPPPSKLTQTTAAQAPATMSKTVAASPFGSHYEHTSAVTVEPFEAPVPSAGPWVPARPLKFSAEEEDALSSGWDDKARGSSRSEEEPEEQVQSPKTVTLSRLLDNVVILEESIKEMASIIQARRALGIDAVRYL